MTNREYIYEKLKAFGITEAQLLDISVYGNIELDEEYTATTASAVGIGMAQGLAELILAPKMTNISESGFSVSWDFANIGKYYLWLCRRWGLTPDEDVIAAAGLNVIKDISDIW